MNNFHENLPFGLSYADLSQAQTLDSSVLHNSQLQNPALQHAHLQDATTAYQSLPTSYTPFPMLQATMHPPQLHQPTVAVSSKDMKPKASRASPRERPADAPIRVTRPPNAFLLFNKEMRKQLKDSNPTMKVAEISKEIGERWKNLSQLDKNRYVSQANNIKETQRALHPNSMYIRRSKAELAKAGHYAKLKRKAMLAQQQDPNNITEAALLVVEGSNQSYAPSSSDTLKQQSTRKRHRRDKNPAAPKHPLSAYMWYLTEVRPETMQTYPGSTVGQISKLCAERWNTMTESERMPWHTKAQADKARYAREMQIYASQHDHPMGRGTRQKYRAAAAAAAAAAANNSNGMAPSPPASSSPASTTPQLSPDNSLVDTDHDTHQQPGQASYIPEHYRSDITHTSHTQHLTHSSTAQHSMAAAADVAAMFSAPRLAHPGG